MGFSQRDSFGQKFEVSTILVFLDELEKKAKPPPSRESRIHPRPPQEFDVIRKSDFKWPKEVKVMTPVELAESIGCTPSTIRKAIYARVLAARRKSPHRWEITKQGWYRSTLS